VQTSVLLLVLSGMACVADLKGEDLVVAVEAQDLILRQMGNVRVSDLLTELMPGNCKLRMELCFYPFWMTSCGRFG
jgi:hypothetical protein